MRAVRLVGNQYQVRVQRLMGPVNAAQKAMLARLASALRMIMAWLAQQVGLDMLARATRQQIRRRPGIAARLGQKSGLQVGVLSPLLLHLISVSIA